jgi:uncharacterized membrane protein HdeD (DUF308 family)
MLKSTSRHLILLGVLAIVVGIIALTWPGPTTLVLVLVVGTWAFIGGCLEIFAAFGSGETAGTCALLILARLVEHFAARPQVQERLT